MNDIFNLPRFCKYFRRDLVSAKNNYLVSLLVSGTLPAIIYFIAQLLNRLFTGSWFSGGAATQAVSFSVAFVVVSFGFCAKVYGGVTDRRMGSYWLMIPASIEEKFLSMALISCLVLPLLLAVMLLGTDAILSAAIPSYGNSVFYLLTHANGMINDAIGYDAIHIGWVPLLYSFWIETVLFFLVGALWFKKSKVSKTILASVVLSIIVIAAMPLFMGRVHIDLNEIASVGDYDSLTDFCTKINVVYSVWNAAITVVLLVLSYLRLRSIKH